MLIFVFEPDTLTRTARQVVRVSLKLVREFKGICKNDPMLNFDVPERIGIGIARGAATRLISKDGRILDYSGRPLNLASRLMDIARPEGVVLDQSFRPRELLTKPLVQHFATESVYLRSVAERTPIQIFYTEGRTEISPLNKRPLDDVQREAFTSEYTVREIEELGRIEIWRIDLPSIPLDEDEILVTVEHPAITAKGAKHPKWTRFFQLNKNKSGFVYGEHAGSPYVDVNARKLAESLREIGIKQSWNIGIEVAYPKR
jgi:hypothetical protein